jgi:hypothetical protein
MVDLAGIGAAAGHLDSAARTAESLARVRVPWLLGGNATASATRLAGELDTQLIDAARAMRGLRVHDRIVQGIEDAVTSVRELGARDPRAVPGAGAGVGEIIGVAREAIATSPVVDEAVSAGARHVREGTVTADGARELVDALRLGQRSLDGQVARTAVGSVQLHDVLERVANGDAGAARLVRAFADDADPEQLLRGMLETPTSEFTAASWSDVAAFAEAHGASAERVAAIARGGESAAARRAVAALRVELDDTLTEPASVREAFRGLVARDATSLTKPDIERLAGLLDINDARRLQVARSVRGARDLDELVDGLLTGASTPGENTTKYLARWQVELDDTLQTAAGRREAFQELVAREPATWSKSDQLRLQVVLDADRASNELGITRTVPGARDLDDLLASLVDGSSTPGSNTARYVARWRTELDGLLDDPARMRSFVEDLATRPDPLAITKEEWERLRLVLERDTSNTLGIARELPGARKLDDLLGALVDGSSTAGGNTARYLANWRVTFDGSLEDPAKVRDGIRAFVDRNPESLSKADWQQLRTLLDADTENAAGIARSLPGVRNLDELLGALVDGTSTVGQNTSAYWAHWRNQFDGLLSDPTRMNAFANQLVARDPATISKLEWTQLRSILAADPDRAAVPLVREIGGTRNLHELLGALIDGTSTPGANTAQYFAMWRSQLDGTLGDATRMRDALRELLVDREPTTLTKADWARVKMFLAYDRETGTLGMTRKLDGARNLDELLTALIDGSSTPGENTAKYLAKWRPELDPTWAARRADAYRAAVHGGPLPVDARADELAPIGITAEAVGVDALRALRLRMLASSAPSSVQGAKEFLAEVRAITGELGAPAADSPIAPVWQRAMELVERNEQRIAGRTPKGAVQGYSNHPDYGELGRIRSDLELVGAVSSDDASRAMAVEGGDAVEGAAEAAAATGSPAEGDVLRW